MREILARSWIVIPAYREAGVLGEVVEQLRSVCPRIVVIDDGSNDGTAEEALGAGATVLTHIVNLGQGAALQTGIEYALLQGAEYVFTFDADGQHNPDSLGALAAAMEAADAEVVLGSRWLGRTESMPVLRRWMLKLAVAFTHWHSGLPLTDTHNGLRLFSRPAAARLRITQPRMAHASEILEQIGKLKLRYKEAPVTVRYTEYSLRKGQKMSGLFKVLIDIFYARWIE